MTDPNPLERFIRAQVGTYATALAELRFGEKRSHWMWFVFPQIAGLGHSPTAQLYAIANRSEAIAYSRHDVLGARLIESTEAVLGWAGKRSAHAVFGPVDALKFKSCMTLFEVTANQSTPFAAALDAFYDGARDAATLVRLGANR